MTFQEFAIIVRSQFLRSFGPIAHADLLGLWKAEASVLEAVDMIAVAYESPDSDLSDRELDLKAAMPTFC